MNFSFESSPGIVRYWQATASNTPTLLDAQRCYAVASDGHPQFLGWVLQFDFGWGWTADPTLSVAGDNNCCDRDDAARSLLVWIQRYKFEAMLACSKTFAASVFSWATACADSDASCQTIAQCLGDCPPSEDPLDIPSLNRLVSETLAAHAGADATARELLSRLEQGWRTEA